MPTRGVNGRAVVDQCSTEARRWAAQRQALSLPLSFLHVPVFGIALRLQSVFAVSSLLGSPEGDGRVGWAVRCPMSPCPTSTGVRGEVEKMH